MATMLEQNIFTVILHYGDPALARGLAASLLEAEPKQPVHVLDNAAPQPYGQGPEAPGAWVRLPRNLYWAGALDYALKAAKAAGAEYLWFLNNDLTFVSAPPFIARAAGRIRRLSGGGQKPGLWSPAMLSSPYHPQMLARKAPAGSDGAWRVALTDGVAPLLCLAAVEEAGGLDYADNPYGYSVDLWLSLRLHRLGWPLVVDQNVVVRHRHHSSAGAVDGFLQTAARAEEAFMRERLGLDWRAVIADLQKMVIPL